MNRSLGFFQLIFYAIGMILGAGIYSVIGKAAGITGESLWFSFIIAAVAALLTALSYAELATLFPKAGAEYVYLQNIFPQQRLLSFLCGTLMVTAAMATAATVSLSFAGYLDRFVEVPHLLTAILILLLFTAVNILGVQESAWMNIVFTTLEISGLIIFVYLGWQNPKFGEALSAPIKGTVISGASLIFFAYLGFENMVNLAEEAKNPDRNIPWAIILSVVLTTVLYILVGLAALALMTPDELSASSAVLSDAVSKHAPSMSGVLGGIALFATANTVMIALLAASRITLGMARGGDLPQIFSRIWEKRQSPWLASILVFLLACLFTLLKRIELVASISSFVTMLVFTVMNISVIYLRKTRPDMKRPFRVPISIKGWPVLPIFGGLVSVFFIFHFEPRTYEIGGLVIALILGLYIVRRFMKV